MSTLKNNILSKNTLILISVIIVTLILWNTYAFIQQFKEEERMKMEIYAEAIKEMSNNPNLNKEFSLVTKIYENVNEIPSILTDSTGNIIAFNNLDSLKVTNKKYLKNLLATMKSENKPIQLNHNKEYVYYQNSALLYKLTYYPIALLLILALFIGISYMFFNSTKVAEQNRLWTGMAKETAHQIGTPLSSLMGWSTILRTEDVNPVYVDEIEKDIARLNVIANRFSKIGSVPNLELTNVVEICQNTFNYLDSRSSKHVAFSFETSDTTINIFHNKELIGWVIENLIKNALDAIQQGKGTIKMTLKKTIKGVKINIKDSGKGIPKSKTNTIFKTGYTTKKRGWGLGLSFSKRIIEDYHEGKIYVKNTENKKGTTFEILLNHQDCSNPVKLFT